MHSNTRPTALRPLAVAALLAWAGTALVQPAGAQPASKAQAARYDLPAGPLDATLTGIARGAGRIIVIDPALVSGRTGAPVRGHLALEQAFAQALAASGLEVVEQDGGAYLLRQASVPLRPPKTVAAATGGAGMAGAVGTATLPSVTVQGAAGAEGRAAQGYRARQSSVAGFGEQSIADTPFSVKVLPSELLANQRVETIATLDRLDASVTASDTNFGSFASPSIRGFGMGSWTNFRYNGQMLVNQQATGLENKERVEILKGLSALQAGFASSGGLINYVTKRPAAEAITDLHFSVNQFGGAKVHADLSRRSEDGSMGIRLNAATQKEQSHVRHADGGRQFVALAADWRVAPDTLLEVDLEHERRNQTVQPDLIADTAGRLPTGVNARRFLGQKWATYPTNFTLVSGKLEHFVNDQWSVVAEANWMKLTRSQSGLLLNGLKPNGDADVNLYYSPDQTREPVNARLVAKGQFDTGPVSHDLSFGAMSHRHKARWGDGFWGPIGSTNIHAPVAIANPSPAVAASGLARHDKEVGLFVNDVLSLGNAWRLHLGGRYAMRDQVSYNTNTGARTDRYEAKVFSPSAAVVFKPMAQVSTYVSYIEGLQQGGVAPIGTTNQNQQLKPLTSQQWEAGIKTELLDGISADAALFRIDQPAEYTNAANTYVQDGLQRNQGLELSLTGKPAREWTLFAGMLLLDAKLKNTADASTQGKRPAGVPKHRLALTAEYSPQPLPGWTFAGNFTRTGNRPLNAENQGEFAPAYNVFGLGTRYETRLGSTPTTVRVNIDNLFNKFHWSGADGSLVVGAPRTISASLSLRF